MESWQKKRNKTKLHKRQDKTRKQEGAGAVNQLEPVSCAAPKNNRNNYNNDKEQEQRQRAVAAKEVQL